MQNPRTVLASSELNLSSALQSGSPSRPVGVPLPVADKKENESLNSALEFFKFSADDIAAIDKIVSVVSTLASITSWAIAAATTVKKVFEFLGFLAPDKDPVLVALKALGERLEQIYGYLKNTVKNDEFKKAVDWRVAMSGLRTAIRDLALSRSPANITELGSRLGPLQAGILQMLSEPYGTIPFLRATYGYGSDKFTTYYTHWIDYAGPFWMTQANGATVNYWDSHQELQAPIWDPGYYFDVLMQAIEARITALAITEPGFRSTAYQRTDLRQIYDGLSVFIAKWEQTILETRIVGPLDPNVTTMEVQNFFLTYPVPGHLVHHPYPHAANGIPMGVVDPVSAVSAFEPDYKDGFQLVHDANRIGDSWAVTNYSAVLASATDHRYQLWSKVRSQCGIATVYRLRDRVGDLIMRSGGSEFVHLSPVEVRTHNVIPGVATGLVFEEAESETVDLGLVGEYSGAPGKKYQVTRYVQQNGEKVFQLSMARRMDVSLIQLGYKLTISLADGHPPQEIVLCPFSVGGGPDLSVFPSQPITRTFESETATVYDVYQTNLFSINDEEDYENTGDFHGTTLNIGGRRVEIALPKRRLYLNPRPGKINFEIGIAFHLDQQNPEMSFVGSATITVRTLDPAQYRDGFILGIQVFETYIGTTAATENTPDVQITELGGAMSLHFAPSFFVTPQDYFTDRDAGQATLGKVLGDVSRNYVRYQAPIGPVDPMNQVAANAAQESALVRTFHQFRRQFPKEEAALLQKFQPPAVERARRMGQSG